jgi:hypothetical protein
MATKLQAGRPDFRIPEGARHFFLFSKNAHTVSVAHVASYSMSTRDSFLEVKGPESEVDHSHYIVPMF